MNELNDQILQSIPEENLKEEFTRILDELCYYRDIVYKINGILNESYHKLLIDKISEVLNEKKS
jgi:hypothetical protein